MKDLDYKKLSHIELFNILVHNREKFNFFELLCRLGFLDTSNLFIQKMMNVSNKFFVLHGKKHNDDEDFLQMINLGEKFDLILYDFYVDLQIESLRKEN